MEPIEPLYRQMIAEYLNGSVNDSFVMIKLMVQVIAILITGLVLWRISSIFSKKKVNRRKSVFMDSRFQKQWKNKS